MDAVYGDAYTILDIADEARWQDFRARRDQLPAPQINSLFIASTVDLAPVKGWRFMGQRFTLDAFIFQNLIFDRVQAGPVLGWTSAVAAYGSFIAPEVIKGQIKAGTPEYAMYGFAIFYAVCLVLNWWFYLRKNAYIKNP